MGRSNIVGTGEAAAVYRAVAQLESRGVDRRVAMRRVARKHGGTVRYVKAALAARDDVMM